LSLSRVLLPLVFTWIAGVAAVDKEEKEEEETFNSKKKVDPTPNSAETPIRPS
jgi:hypothetical protein